MYLKAENTTSFNASTSKQILQVHSLIPISILYLLTSMFISFNVIIGTLSIKVEQHIIAMQQFNPHQPHCTMNGDLVGGTTSERIMALKVSQ